MNSFLNIHQTHLPKTYFDRVVQGERSRRSAWPFAFVEELQMAEKKTTTKKAAKPKTETVVYNKQKYTVLERNDRKVCLTDGTIHFWVKACDVED